jgi:hypothetical protein
MLGRVVGLQQLVGGGQLVQASLTQAVGPRQQLYKENLLYIQSIYDIGLVSSVFRRVAVVIFPKFVLHLRTIFTPYTAS